MSLFRDYIKLRANTKEPLEAFKNQGPHRSYEEALKLQDFAGVLAHTTVLIDVDDGFYAEKLLSIIKDKNIHCRVNKTTRGMHFFFKNDGNWTTCATHAYLAIGIKADIKVGTSNCYAVLKKNGLLRETIYDVHPYEVVPKWLTIVHPTQKSENLFGMNEGNGRNDALFNHIIPLQRAGLNQEESRETLSIINNYVFEKPLSDNEFKTVTRDEAFIEAVRPVFFKGKQLQHHDFSNYLVKELHIKKINGQLHFFQNGTYVSNDNALNLEMLRIIKSLKTAQRKEVLEYLNIIAKEEYIECNSHLIAFRNGIYDLKKDSLLPFSPEIVITNRIPWDYNPDAYSKLADDTLNQWACNDMQMRLILEEIIGYCFFRRNELRKAFILLGDKGNGKSTFIHIVATILGKANYSTLDLKDFETSFRPAEIYGKLANLGDDIDDHCIEKVSIIKKFISGDEATVEKKHQQPFSFENFAKMIFSANKMPKINDATGAVKDRLMIIPFKGHFNRNSPNYHPFLKDDLKKEDAIEYLIRVGILGLKRVLNQKGFSHSEVVDFYNSQPFQTNQSVFEEFTQVISIENIDVWSCCKWYEEYRSFCKKRGFEAGTQQSFGRLFKDRFNLKDCCKKVDGKTVKFYEFNE